MSTGFGDMFWPPVDDLAAAAERIRARLGEWPVRRAPMRICVAAPERAQPGDLLVVTSGDAEAGRAAEVIAAGGAALEIGRAHV